MNNLIINYNLYDFFRMTTTKIVGFDNNLAQLFFAICFAIKLLSIY